MRKTHLIGITTVLLEGTVVRAQDTNAPDPERRPPAGPAAGQNFAPVGLAIGGMVRVLTDQQRASYQAAMRAQRGNLQELEVKLRAARHEMEVASVTGQFDENAVRQKALAASRIEAE